MKKIYIATIITCLLLTLIVFIIPVPVAAQRNMSSQIVSTSDSMIQLERRIQQLEIRQAETIEALKSNNEYNRFLITLVTGIIALLVGIQGFTSYSQIRREKKRDLTESTGIDQVSKVMGILHQTMDDRRLAEKEAHEKEKVLQNQTDKVFKEIQPILEFGNRFQEIIRNERNQIEEFASIRAKKYSRHEFRKIITELLSFAQQFDRFNKDYKPIEKDTAARFTSHVVYIRGVAAHYANQPAIAKHYLSEVAGFSQPEQGEDRFAYDRRVANAYYYLGITESNFGNQQEAIRYFEQANKLDPNGVDYLTRVVFAEAYAMGENPSEALPFILKIKNELLEKERSAPLAYYHLRLKNRAILIEANITIRERKENWLKETNKLLSAVYKSEPEYYYATATLAQVQFTGNDLEDARDSFSKAYNIIDHSGDLHTAMEVRSKILLFMVAGMCCKHGLNDDKRAMEYFAKADELCGDLPKIETQVSTVFSTLSKRNEANEIIHDHIKMIRGGKVLV